VTERVSESDFHLQCATDCVSGKTRGFEGAKLAAWLPIRLTCDRSTRSPDHVLTRRAHVGVAAA
jgi:hypothetical protein